MAIITAQCPHCSVQHIALRVVTVVPTGTWEANVYLECPKCGMPACGRLLGHGQLPRVTDLQSSGGDLLQNNWTMIALWPEPPQPRIPGYLPEPVARALLQAERNFPVDGNEEAAGTMYRKALDVGLKAIAPEASGTLAKRIDQLVAAGQLTRDLGKWAHHIRQLGNDSAHDEDPPTREELAALRAFSELVLTYLFTLPAQVAARRAKPE